MRVGPNHLHIWDSDAIAPIYNGSRSMGKPEFHSAFTASNLDPFGTTNSDVSCYRVLPLLIYSDHREIHSLRRRQLVHGFSQASIVNLEPLIEVDMKFLNNKLLTFAQTRETFDPKLLLSLYVFDILGSVAFVRHLVLKREAMRKYCLQLMIIYSWLISRGSYLYKASSRRSAGGHQFSG